MQGRLIKNALPEAVVIAHITAPGLLLDQGW
jgi:hypothetical protein